MIQIAKLISLIFKDDLPSKLPSSEKVPKLHMNYPGWGTEIHYLYDGYTIILTKEEFDRRINEAFNAGVRLGEEKKGSNNVT